MKILAMSDEAARTVEDALGLYAKHQGDLRDAKAIRELQALVLQTTPERGPYTVRWGYCNEEAYDCPTFQDALAVLRFIAERATRTGFWVEPSISSADADADGRCWNDGLSDEQREAMGEALALAAAARARRRASEMKGARHAEA